MAIIIKNSKELKLNGVFVAIGHIILSDLAKRFFSSDLGMRYDFGRGTDGVVSVDFFGNFAAITHPEMHDIIDEANNKANKLLNAAAVNFNCLSGAHAMLCALLGTSRPGDTIMSVREEDGGHFCTKKIIEVIGRKHVFAEYDLQKLTFNVEKTAKIFIKSNATVLYLDTSVLLKPHPLKELRKLLPKKSIIIYDASHTLGLIMGGEFQSPLTEGADLISANTHKTFPGPHRGLLAFRTTEIADRVNSIISNTLYSTVQTNSLLALAISIIEMDSYGREYAKQIIKNSIALGLALKSFGLKVRKVDGVHSYNHQVHLFIDIPARDAVLNFLQNGISINSSDALGGKVFIRFGTQEVTKRGMKEKDMNKIAGFIKQILDGKKITKEVFEFNSLFTKTYYCLPFKNDL